LQANGVLQRGFLLQALPADRQIGSRGSRRDLGNLSILGQYPDREELLLTGNQTAAARLIPSGRSASVDPATVRFGAVARQSARAIALGQSGAETPLALLAEQAA